MKSNDAAPNRSIISFLLAERSTSPLKAEEVKGIRDCEAERDTRPGVPPLRGRGGVLSHTAGSNIQILNRDDPWDRPERYCG